MKKRLFTAICAGVLAFTGVVLPLRNVAQTVNFGLTAGWAPTITTGLLTPFVNQPARAFGLGNGFAGAYADLRLSGPLHFGVEGLLASQNTSGAYLMRDSLGGFSQSNGQLREVVLQVPLVFSYQASDIASAEIGVVVTYLLSSKIQQINLTETNYSSNRNSVDYGFATGIIIRLHPHLSVHGRLIRNFTGMYRQLPVDSPNNNYITGQLMVRFHLRGVKSEVDKQ